MKSNEPGPLLCRSLVIVEVRTLEEESRSIKKKGDDTSRKELNKSLSVKWQPC